MNEQDYSINAAVGPVFHEKGGKLNELHYHHNLAGIEPE
jgi:hypothetical protein